MPTSSDISADGVFLLDTCGELILWVGSQADPAFLEALFGTRQPADGAVPLSGDATATSDRFQSLARSLAAQRPHDAPVSVIVQGSAQQHRFFSRLFADGYEPFMLNLQSRVAPKL